MPVGAGPPMIGTTPAADRADASQAMLPLTVGSVRVPPVRMTPKSGMLTVVPLPIFRFAVPVLAMFRTASQSVRLDVPPVTGNPIPTLTKPAASPTLVVVDAIDKPADALVVAVPPNVRLPEAIRETMALSTTVAFEVEDPVEVEELLGVDEVEVV